MIYVFDKISPVIFVVSHTTSLQPLAFITQLRQVLLHPELSLVLDEGHSLGDQKEAVAQAG